MLVSYSEGRDNNFNLLRLAAAILVILTHSFGMTGHGLSEPLSVTFGTSFGSWAVDIFFVASGFLIAKSWDRSKNVSEFVRARFFRIYPGLWVCIFVCVFVIGIAFTKLPWSDFLVHIDTIKFIAENTTLILNGVSTSLPKTFSELGDGKIIFPLWTLPYEVKMYIALLVLGWTGWLYKRGIVGGILVAAFAVYAWSLANNMADSRVSDLSRLTFFFASGTYAFLRRHSIPLRTDAAVVMAVLLGASVLVERTIYHTLLLTLATPYLVLYCAFVPSGLIRSYNRVGDYSYGMYIYGAPIQNVVLATAGGTMTVQGHFWASVTGGALCAVISWHAIESRAITAGRSRLFQRRRARAMP